MKKFADVMLRGFSGTALGWSCYTYSYQNKQHQLGPMFKDGKVPHELHIAPTAIGTFIGATFPLGTMAVGVCVGGLIGTIYIVDQYDTWYHNKVQEEINKNKRQQQLLFPDDETQTKSS